MFLNHFKLRKNRRPHRGQLPFGLTLIEAALVLAISAVVIASVMVYFQAVDKRRRESITAAVVSQIVDGVHTLYSSSVNYAGLNTAGVATKSFIPKRLVEGTNINSPMRGGSKIFVKSDSIAGRTANGNFDVAVSALGYDACLALGVLDMGTSVYDVQIINNVTSETGISLATGSSVAVDAASGNSAVDVSKVATQCELYPSATVVWVFE